MHVSDGVLPPQLWIAGAVAAAVPVAYAVRRFDERLLPRVSVSTSVFFVASSVHVPVAGVSVHLLLTGLLGIVLGSLSFPSILVGLFLQAILLGHGGITTLGVNTLILGAGACTGRGIFVGLRRLGPGWTIPASFLAAVGAVLASAGVLAGLLSLAGKGLQTLTPVYILPNLALSILDGVVTAGAAGFLLRVRPDLLPGCAPRAATSGGSTAPGGSTTPGGPRDATAMLSLAALLAALLWGDWERPALAHGLLVDARRDGRDVVVEAYFSDGTPARGARVLLEDAAAASGSPPLGGGATGADGTLRLPAFDGALRVIVEDGAGHRGEASLAPDAGASSRPPMSSLGPPWLRIVVGLAALAGLTLLLRAAIRKRGGADGG